jgi:ribonucleoside-diphosphate reductase alpha chain
MSTRERLPNRRSSTTFAIESRGLAFTVTVSAFDSGELAEVFITNHHAQSGAGIMASDGAIAASLALQFGCPADVLRKALSRDSGGRANGRSALRSIRYSKLRRISATSARAAASRRHNDQREKETDQ